MKAYVDTNILVDLVLAREEFLSQAQSIFALGYCGEVQLVVSALSFVNTIYLGKKYRFPSEEVARKLRLIADSSFLRGKPSPCYFEPSAVLL